MLVNCAHCGRTVSGSASDCVHCGNPPVDVLVQCNLCKQHLPKRAAMSSNRFPGGFNNYHRACLDRFKASYLANVRLSCPECQRDLRGYVCVDSLIPSQLRTQAGQKDIPRVCPECGFPELLTGLFRSEDCRLCGLPVYPKVHGCVKSYRFEDGCSERGCTMHPGYWKNMTVCHKPVCVPGIDLRKGDEEIAYRFYASTGSETTIIPTSRGARKNCNLA